jgi:DNA-binding transcriptional ArsR family regulator
VGITMSLGELITKRSKKCELFSNPLRSFIAVFIAAKREVTWSELKKALGKWAGHVNPNTLSFHLGELKTAGFIDKVDIKGQPRYRFVDNKLSEIQRLAGEDLIRKMKEEF